MINVPVKTEDRLSMAGAALLRYGLAVIVLWFGVFKFTDAEAQAIQPLIANSPVLGWLYSVADLGSVSRLIGVTEIGIALLIASRLLSPALSAAGSLGAIAMFTTTLSFLFTTPGMWSVVEGVLVPSGAGAFIVKDVLLLGAAAWTAGEALAATDRTRLPEERPVRAA